MKKEQMKKRLADLFNGVHLPRRSKSGLLPEKEYYKTLPRKRSSAGVVIIKDGKVLMLNLSYQKTLGVPGGVVDKDESPLAAAVRECREELGVDIDIKRLLAVDYCNGGPVKGDTYGFVFLGDIGAQEIKMDGKEITGYSWLKPEEAMAGLIPVSARRLAIALKALREDRVIFSEEGVEPNVLAPKGKPHGRAAQP